MIQHRQSRLFLRCLLLVYGLGAVVQGQATTPVVVPAPVVAPAPLATVVPLPAGVVTNANAATDRAIIAKYVSGYVARLSYADPSAWKFARDELTRQIANPNATPSFLDEYADAINTAILPLAKHSDDRVRLNASIIAARVAARSGGSKLAKSTQTFLLDKSDAVVLWAMQAAKFEEPALVISTNFKMAQQLDQSVVEACKAHMTGPVIEEAYRALTFDPSGGTATAAQNPLQNISADGIKKCLPSLNNLLGYRVKMYDDATPPMPLADTWAARYLVKPEVWGAQNPQEKTATLQLMVALLKGASKQNLASDSLELRDVISRTGDAFQAVSGQAMLNNGAMNSAARSLASLPKTFPATDIDAKIAALEATIK